jgi:hypothetical protein
MIIDWKFKKILEQTNGVDLSGINKKTQRKNSNLEIMFCGFPREKTHTWASLSGLVHLG